MNLRTWTLALGATAAAVPAYGQECDDYRELIGRDSEPALRSYGEPSLVLQSGRDQVLTWVDSRDGSSLVMKVDARDAIVSLEATPNWAANHESPFDIYGGPADPLP